MVKPSGNRLIFFLFGITLGLLVGAGFFIFKIDEYISRMELFNQQQSDSLQEINKNGEPSEKQKKGSKPSYTNTKKDLTNTGDSMVSELEKTQSADSFFADSMYSVSRINEDQIEVKKDELITSRSMPISGTGTFSKSPKDSLLQTVSGIRDDKNQSSAVAVEFWLSPINYKGYKMTRNKLVLFGIPGNAPVSIHRVDGNLFLRVDQSVYRLENTDDFKSLDKISDPELISKIQ